MARPKKSEQKTKKEVNWVSSLSSYYLGIESPKSVECELLITDLNLEYDCVLESIKLGIIIYENRLTGIFNIYDTSLKLIMSKPISKYKSIEDLVMCYLYDKANELLLDEKYTKKYDNFVLTLGLVVDAKNSKVLDLGVGGEFTADILGNLAFGGRCRDGIVDLSTLEYLDGIGEEWDEWKIHDVNGENLLIGGVDEIIPLRKGGYLLRHCKSYKRVSKLKNFMVYSTLESNNLAGCHTLSTGKLDTYVLMQYENGEDIVFYEDWSDKKLYKYNSKTHSTNWTSDELGFIKILLRSKVKESRDYFISKYIDIDVSKYTCISSTIFLDKPNNTLLTVTDDCTGFVEHPLIESINVVKGHTLYFYKGVDYALLNNKHQVYSKISLTDNPHFGVDTVLFLDFKSRKTIIVENIKDYHHLVRNKGVDYRIYSTKDDKLYAMNLIELTTEDITHLKPKRRPFETIVDYTTEKDSRDEYILLENEFKKNVSLLGDYMYSLISADKYGVYDLYCQDISKHDTIYLDTNDDKKNIKLKPIIYMDYKNKAFKELFGVYIHNNDIVITCKGGIKTLKNFYTMGYADSKLVKELYSVLGIVKSFNRFTPELDALVDDFLNSDETKKNLKSRDL